MLAESLPPALISEYESGTVCKEDVITKHNYGVVSHTLVTTSQAEPSRKRAKTSSSAASPGYVYNINGVAEKCDFKFNV